MMNISFQTVILFILHIILPLYLLSWLSFSKSLSLIFKISIIALISVYLLFLARAGTWQVFGLFWNYLYLGLFIIAICFVAYNWNKIDLLPKNTLQVWTNLGSVIIVFLVLLFWRIPQIYNARSFPEPAIELKFPLRNGQFLITQGGATHALNQHYSNSAQKFALDIVKIDPFGFRANSFLPSKLEQYYIFKHSLYAPCSGEVLAIKNDVQDQIPPATDLDNIAGNYVLLLCKEHSILLAHMHPGSVTVLPGQKLDTNRLIGHVGNSGNTTEPHLHIHAVKGRVSSVEEVIQSAEAVPMLFAEKFLIRNDRLTFN